MSSERYFEPSPNKKRRSPIAKRIDLDPILQTWLFDPMSLSVRRIKAKDRRFVLQMRVEMGVIQMETRHRPDGTRPGGFKSFLSMYSEQSRRSEGPFSLDQNQYSELLRELTQFHTRLMSWSALESFPQMISDAMFCLQLLDFIRDYSPIPSWSKSLEANRAGLLYHLTYAKAARHLAQHRPEEASATLSLGIVSVSAAVHNALLFPQMDISAAELREWVPRLRSFQDWIISEHHLTPPLSEQWTIVDNECLALT